MNLGAVVEQKLLWTSNPQKFNLAAKQEFGDTGILYGVHNASPSYFFQARSWSLLRVLTWDFPYYGTMTKNG